MSQNSFVNNENHYCGLKRYPLVEETLIYRFGALLSCRWCDYRRELRCPVIQAV